MGSLGEAGERRGEAALAGPRREGVGCHSLVDHAALPVADFVHQRPVAQFRVGQSDREGHRRCWELLAGHGHQRLLRLHLRPGRLAGGLIECLAEKRVVVVIVQVVIG